MLLVKRALALGDASRSRSEMENIAEAEPANLHVLEVGRRAWSAKAIRSTRKMNPGELEIRFARCRGLLHFVACRVLGGSEGADRAVENCFLTAARNPQQFEYEGAFRSWLARIVIDEALAIVRERKRGLKCEEE